MQSAQSASSPQRRPARCRAAAVILVKQFGELFHHDAAELFGIDGPLSFNDRWLALGSNTAAYVWKWMPFRTLIFLAARMTIPRDIYDAALVDGATGVRRFVHVTFPLLANLYLICTLLSVLWTLDDFTTVYLVSGGAWNSDVLATLGFRREPCSAQYIKQCTRTHKSTISRAVTALLERELIERVANAASARGVDFELIARLEGERAFAGQRRAHAVMPPRVRRARAVAVSPAIWLSPRFTMRRRQAARERP